MHRLLEFGFLGVWGASGLASAMTAADVFLQFGALGLVGFMLVQNDRQRRELMQANVEFSKALNRICTALEDRPCVVGDSRIMRHRPHHPQPADHTKE